MRTRLRPARGQALVEFLGLALVLVPILLLLPMIAKYQDMAHSTEMAARYVAFDATIRNDAANGGWKPNDQLAGEVRRRFFSNPTAPIKTNDVPGDFKAHQNLFWRDPLNNSLIRSFDNDVGVSFGETASTSRAAGFRGASDGTVFLNHGLLNLDARGIFRGNVSVTVANVPATLNGPTHSYDGLKAINLVLRRHMDLVPDAWTAHDAADVASHLSNPLVNPGTGPVPAVLKAATDAAALVMESPGGVCAHCGPKIGKLDYWREVVPADRIAH
jgi:hypothetical protein